MILPINAFQKKKKMERHLNSTFTGKVYSIEKRRTFWIGNLVPSLDYKRLSKIQEISYSKIRECQFGWILLTQNKRYEIKKM